MIKLNIWTLERPNHVLYTKDTGFQENFWKSIGKYFECSLPILRQYICFQETFYSACVWWMPDFLYGIICTIAWQTSWCTIRNRRLEYNTNNTQAFLFSTDDSFNVYRFKTDNWPLATGKKKKKKSAEKVFKYISYFPRKQAFTFHAMAYFQGKIRKNIINLSSAESYPEW